jgi:hypothetical protein
MRARLCIISTVSSILVILLVVVLPDEPVVQNQAEPVIAVIDSSHCQVVGSKARATTSIATVYYPPTIRCIDCRPFSVATAP